MQKRTVDPLLYIGKTREPPLPNRAQRIAWWGDPSDPDWHEHNIVHSRYFTAHRLAHRAMVALIDAWMDAGLFGLVITIDRVYEPGNPNHEFGVALDINSQWNPLGQHAPAGATGCVLELVPIARQLGFTWRSYAARHFELLGSAL